MALNNGVQSLKIPSRSVIEFIFSGPSRAHGGNGIHSYINTDIITSTAFSSRANLHKWSICDVLWKRMYITQKSDLG